MSIEKFGTGKPYEAGFRHSAAVRVDGDLLYTAGIVARTDAGMVGKGDVGAQATQITETLLDILAKAGTDAGNIIKLTVYVLDIDDYLAVRAATDPLYVGKPASTLIEIGKLASPDILIEIELVAYVPGGPSVDTPVKQPFGTGKPWEARARHAPGNKTGIPLTFTAGVTARDDAGGIVGPGDLTLQTERTVSNLTDALKAGGSDPSRIVKLILFVMSIDDFMSTGSAACAPLFVNKPSSTLIEVTRLQDPGLLIEIEAVAETDRA